MTKLNSLGIILGQEVFVTQNILKEQYTPNVHKERVTAISKTCFYTASSFDKHHYQKQYSLVTGISDVGKKHYKAFATEKDYLESITK